jgi:hypothetical protein
MALKVWQDLAQLNVQMKKLTYFKTCSCRLWF